jgi:hypothetical protein
MTAEMITKCKMSKQYKIILTVVTRITQGSVAWSTIMAGRWVHSRIYRLL